MATTKLTLSADRDTIELAKNLASEDKISVSKLFKTLVTDLARKRKKKYPILEKYKDVVISDDIKALTGILKGKYSDDITLWEAKYQGLKEDYDL